VKGERDEQPNWPTAIINIARGIAPGELQVFDKLPALLVGEHTVSVMARV